MTSETSNIPESVQCLHVGCGVMRMEGADHCSRHRGMGLLARVVCDVDGCEAAWDPLIDHHPSLCARHEADAKDQRMHTREPDEKPARRYCDAPGCASYNRPDVGPGQNWNLCEKHAIELRKRAATGEPVEHTVGINAPKVEGWPVCEKHPWILSRSESPHACSFCEGTLMRDYANSIEEELPRYEPDAPTGAELVERVRTFVQARIARGHDRDCTRTILMILLAGSTPSQTIDGESNLEQACDCGLREMREILGDAS